MMTDTKEMIKRIGKHNQPRSLNSDIIRLFQEKDKQIKEAADALRAKDVQIYIMKHLLIDIHNDQPPKE
jgi:hypothetical protein